MACQLEARETERRFPFVPRVGPLQGSLYQRHPFWLPDFLRDEESTTAESPPLSLPSSIIPSSPPEWLKPDPTPSPVAHTLGAKNQFLTQPEVQFPKQSRCTTPLWEVLSQEAASQAHSFSQNEPLSHTHIVPPTPPISSSCSQQNFTGSKVEISGGGSKCSNSGSFDQFKFRTGFDRSDSTQNLNSFGNPHDYHDQHPERQKTHPPTLSNPSQGVSLSQANEPRWAQFLDQGPQRQSINPNSQTQQPREIKPPLASLSYGELNQPDNQPPIKLQPLRLHPLQLSTEEKYQGDPLLKPHFDNEVVAANKPEKKTGKGHAVKEPKRPKPSKPQAKNQSEAAPSSSAKEKVVDLDLTVEPSATPPDSNAKPAEKSKASLTSPTVRYKQTTLGPAGSAVTPEKSAPGSAKKKTKIQSRANVTPEGARKKKKQPEGALERTEGGDKVKAKRKKPKGSKKDGKLSDLIDGILEDQLEVDPTPLPGTAASRYDFFSSQRAFSKYCLDFLEQNFKDIRTNLPAFQRLAHTADRVVVAMFWDDGSTSYRSTTIEQRKAVRTFRRNDPPPPVIDAFPTDRSERDPLALVFRFSDDQFMLSLSTEMQPTEQTAIMDLFRNELLDKIAFDAKNILWALLCHCKTLPLYPIPRLMDPQIASWLCDPDNEAHTSFELPGLLTHYPSARYVKSSVAQFTLPQLIEDVNNTGVLAELLKQRLDQEGLWDSFAEQEMQMVPLLAVLQFNGIAFDRGLFTSRRHVLALQLASLEQQACAAVGKQFLLTSPEQVARILFEDLKLPQVNSADRGRSGATNNRHHSTGNEILAKLSSLHPLPGIILQHRTLSKKLSTYMDPMIRASCPDRQHPEAGYRIYSQWHHVLTGTGRLSSSKPNLQSLPRPSKPASAPKLSFAALLDPAESVDEVFDDMVNIREAFVVSDPNKVLLSADFSQMEMRILALLSKDPSLQMFFNQAQGDIYNLLASACFKLAPDQVKSSDRDKAKAVSLGIIYGMGPQSTAEQLTRHNPDQPMTVEEAKLLIGTWHKTFPLVRVFINKTVALARQKGYVCTLSNRRRYLPNIKSTQTIKRSYAERQSVNTVIQGSAADIMKRGMSRLFASLRELPEAAELVLQLHDEVVLEVSVPALRQVQDLVRHSLEEVVSGSSIRFPVNIKTGKSLGTLRSLA